MVTPSRGCVQCRRQHVKCDETRPACRRCVRLSLSCSGAISGALFFDETEKVKRKHPARHKRPLVGKAGRGRGDGQDVVSQPGEEERGNGDHLKLVRKMYASQFQVPPAQPARQEMFAEMLVSHLPNAFAGFMLDPSFEFDENRLSEFCKRPASQSIPNVEFAGRAVSMAFYSGLTKHPSIEKASYEWYARALNCQQSLLQSGIVGDSDTLSDAIYACLMMMYYEVVVCTTPFGWATHAAAAISLLESIGPENCQTRKMNVVFRHLRMAAMCLAIHSKTPSPLSQEEWRTIPFVLYPKLPLDELVDLILCIPTFQAACQNLFDRSGEVLPNASPEDVDDFFQGLGQLQGGLDDWHARYRGGPSNESIPLKTSVHWTVKDAANNSHLTVWVTSLYHMARILTHYLMIRCTTSSESIATHVSEITNHSDSVLALASEELEHRPAATGCVYLICPVKMVYICSYKKEQTVAAQRILAQWARHKLMGSIFVSSISWVQAIARY